MPDTKYDSLLKSKLQKTLLETLHIESEYPYEDEISRYIQDRFQKTDIAFQLDDFGNIIAKIPGSGSPIMLSTHIDIPETIPNLGYTIEDDIIRSDGQGILGVDPKSGLAILLELLSELADKPSNYCPLEIVLTRGEEKGLLGAKNLDYSLIEADVGLVLDEDGPLDNVVIQAPACVYVNAVFAGKAAHPREPGKAQNALQAATDAMNALPWGFTEDGTMWNIGFLEAGTARNTVPGTAILKGELRNHDNDLIVKEAEYIKSVLQKHAESHGVDCEVELIRDAQGYTHDRGNRIMSKLASTYAAVGREPNYYSTLGRSDANVFNAQGIPAAAIGSGYYNAHQYSEYANLQDMVEIYDFLKQFDKVHAEKYQAANEKAPVSVTKL